MPDSKRDFESMTLSQVTKSKYFVRFEGSQTRVLVG